MVKKYIVIIGVCFLSLFCLLSCGLEDFSYIDYIPQGSYDGARASIRLPSSSNSGYGSDGDYFTHFIIFYRIYISASNISPSLDLIASSDSRSSINATLNSDYSNIYPSTDITSTSVTTSNLENTFLNRNYYPLSLEGANIDNVLGAAALGRRLDIFFDTQNGERPTLRLDNGVAYVLQRAQSGSGFGFNPRPDTMDLFRSFLNHPELYDKDNATKEINADVATNTRDTDIRYTYVSMYIAAVGKNSEMPPKTIYSQPTFIGIFMLAEWS